MARYPMSNGEYIEKSIIDSRTEKAKAEKKRIQIEDEGYLYCKTCGRNDCLPVTTAHIISVDESQKTGRSELAWDLENMINEGLPCHQKRDKLNLGL